MSTQTLGFPSNAETLAEKRERASHNIYVGIQLLNEIQEAVKTEKCEQFFPNIHTYMLKMHEVLSKFCKVYFKYNITEAFQIVSDTEPYTSQISAICNFLSAISKFIKVRVHVMIRDDGQALDMLHRIYGRKFNHRIQNFLLRIDYWVDKMSVEEKLRYNLF